MIFSYYPGCTLKNKAQDLDRYARASAEKLGVTLQELENWQCCGGYAVMEDKKIAQKKSTAVMENAADMQADTLVTACPLCLYNLTKNASGEHRLPVVYFTELLAEALGVKD